MFFCCAQQDEVDQNINSGVVQLVEVDGADNHKSVPTLTKGPNGFRNSFRLHTDVPAEVSSCACWTHSEHTQVATNEVSTDVRLMTHKEESPTPEVIKERSIPKKQRSQDRVTIGIRFDDKALEDRVLREFEVNVKKGDEQKKLGLRVDYQDEVVLRVVDVREDSLISQWNAEHPTMQVEIGDCVMAVNGKNGSSSDMLEELGAATKMCVSISKDFWTSECIRRNKKKQDLKAVLSERR